MDAARLTGNGMVVVIVVCENSVAWTSEVEIEI